MSSENSKSTGIGIGAVIAALISWSVNHSIFWAIIHALFSWFYVLYYLGGCAGEIK